MADGNDGKKPVLTEFPDAEKMLQEVEIKQEENKRKVTPPPSFQELFKQKKPTNLPN